jgi:hypothetical protein
MKSLTYPIYRVRILWAAIKTWFTQIIHPVDKKIIYSRNVRFKGNKRYLQLTHCVSMKLLGRYLFVNECGMPGLHVIFFISSTHLGSILRGLFSGAVFVSDI